MILSILVAVVKVGIIGCDTSHTLAFTEVMNVKKPAFADGFQVTHAHQWGSKDIFSSTNRYPAYIAKMTGMGVEMCPTVDDLLKKVDVVCLETNDGREHLWQAEKVFAAGKRVFIDKPIAEDYAHAKAIYDLGKKYNAKYFSSSTLRYTSVHNDIHDGKYGKIKACIVSSPSPLEIQGTHSRYVWYGIHGFETMMTVMGPGAESVRASSSGDRDVVVVTWKDGRSAILKLDQRDWRYGGIAYPEIVDEDAEAPKPVSLAGPEGYEPLLKRIVQFFKDGVVPVPAEETLEIFAITEAAAKSHAEGGREVNLSEITDCGKCWLNWLWN